MEPLLKGVTVNKVTVKSSVTGQQDLREVVACQRSYPKGGVSIEIFYCKSFPGVPGKVASLGALLELGIDMLNTLQVGFLQSD